MSRTIAAVSTPYGKGGIAVIRLSGDKAITVAEKMFFPVSGCALSSVKSGSAVYGRIVSQGNVIDDGIAVIYRNPHSYTGEDTVEISCHGGILITQRVLETAFDCGAVPAERGEFTKRAFINGKIDLTEAEAVIGLIDADSEEKLRLCVSHTQGVLKRRSEEIYREISGLLSAVYVKIDYPEEDLSELTSDEIADKLETVKSKLSETIKTYRHGKAVSDGVKTAIIGKPNAGKSSLMNRLCGEDRAIVTSKAGTTRDVIEEKVQAGRVVLRLWDTAGIRESGDEIEIIGIERARAKAREAELLLAVFDVSGEIGSEDEEIIDLISEARERRIPVIAVFNKEDIAVPETVDKLKSMLGDGVVTAEISCTDGEGIEELKMVAERQFVEREIDYSGEAVVANARQFSAFCRAFESVERAKEALLSGLSADICGLDLEQALMALGEVDGRAVSEDVTAEIFRNFCVGK